MVSEVAILDSQGLSLDLAKQAPLEFLFITFLGAMLSGAAGFVNGVTLQGMTGTSSFTTSHMTGTSTVSAESLGRGAFEDFGVRLCLVISFSFGAFLVGAYTGSPSKSYQIGPEYGPLLFILSVILSVACVCAYVDPDSYEYYYLASMAMGFQNSMTSKYSGSLIRTTHVTGTLTDIGLILGQYSRGITDNLWKLPVLLALVISFAIGGVLSITAERNKLSLIVVAIFYGSLALGLQIFIAYARRQSLLSVFLGSWEHIVINLPSALTSSHPYKVFSPLHESHDGEERGGLEDNRQPQNSVNVKQ